MSGLVVSLFDLSGEWARPWFDSGCDVLLVDLAHTSPDVDGMPTLVCDMATPEGLGAVLRAVGERDVDVVLAAPPCTCFTRAAACRWPGQDATGRTDRDLGCVKAVVALVSCLQPRVWALENPPGRILPDVLGPPRLAWDPWRFGALAPECPKSRDTKRTYLWGKFRAPTPAPLERAPYPDHLPPGGRDPVTRMSSSARREWAQTPRGFARAFYLANRAAA